jgi:hypothetical protein
LKAGESLFVEIKEESGWLSKKVSADRMKKSCDVSVNASCIAPIEAFFLFGKLFTQIIEILRSSNFLRVTVPLTLFSHHFSRGSVIGPAVARGSETMLLVSDLLFYFFIREGIITVR